MTFSRLAAALTIAGVAACSVPTDHEPTGSVASPIIHGTSSPAGQDAVVLVMHYDAIKIGGDTAGCTGTMLTPRLVLTARHCVSNTDEQAACDSMGNATFGGAVTGDLEASKLFAFPGTQRPDFISGLDKGSRGAEIIDDGSKTLCNHDIALILLEKALPGVKTAPIRLDAPPRKDESVLVVGWGITDKAPMPQVRQQRAGVKILDVGPAERLGPSEFKLGESGCAGDSGGPAFSETSGAVLGVLSRGGNNTGAQPGDVAGCINAENVFTTASGFKDLIVSAYEKAGQDAWFEGQPDPTTLPPKPKPPADDSSSGCAVATRPRASGKATAPFFIVVAAIAVIAACRSRRLPRILSG